MQSENGYYAGNSRTCSPCVERRRVKLVVVITELAVSICEKFNIWRHRIRKTEKDFLISSCKPLNTACVVESIGIFVADISVVADRKDLSHDITNLMDSQSSLCSSKGWRSLFLETKESIVSR